MTGHLEPRLGARTTIPKQDGNAAVGSWMWRLREAWINA